MNPVRQRATRLLVPLAGAVVVNIALLVFLTRLSGNVALPELGEGDRSYVVPIVPPDQARPEPPPPPPPKPPPLNEKPEIPPTQIDNVLQPVLGPSLGSGIDIGVPIQDADVSGLAFFEGDLDRKPRAVVNVVQYPYRAQRLQIEGVVNVRFTVLQDGSVRDVVILSAKPEGIFEEAVMQAVPRWKYEPGLVGGKPVVWTNITEVIFELEP